MTTFKAKPALILACLGLLVLFATQAVSLVKLDSVGDDQRKIIESQRRIETVIVKPICVAQGTEDDCRRLLRTADEGRVASLCYLTAATLRQAGIDAACTVRSPDRPDVEQGIGDPKPGAQGSSPGRGTGSDRVDGVDGVPPATDDPPPTDKPPPDDDDPPTGGGGNGGGSGLGDVVDGLGNAGEDVLDLTCPLQQQLLHQCL